MIDKKDTISEITSQYPQATQILEGYGMRCAGCMAAHFESLEDGATVHGMDVDTILKKIEKE